MGLPGQHLQDAALELARALCAELALVMQRADVGQRYRAARPGAVQVLRVLRLHRKARVVLATI